MQTTSTSNSNRFCNFSFAPPTSTAVRSEERSFTPDFYLPPVQKAQNTAKKVFPGRCADLFEEISGPIEEHVNSLDYNSLCALTQLISHFDRHPEDDEVSLMREGPIDCTDEDITSCSSACIGFARSILKKLKEMHIDEGEIIAESSKETPDVLIHAAVIIPCIDGYILLDPANYPCFIEFDNEVVFDHGMIIRTTGKDDPCLERITPGNPEEVTYLRRGIVNADPIIMAKYFLKKYYYPVISARRDQKFYPYKTVKISPEKKEVAFQYFKGATKAIVDRFSFDEILRQKAVFGEKLDQFMESDFSTPSLILYTQILKTISAAAKIRALYRQVQSFHYTQIDSE